MSRSGRFRQGIEHLHIVDTLLGGISESGPSPDRIRKVLDHESVLIGTLNGNPLALLLIGFPD